MSRKLNRLLLVSLNSPHLETFYFLIKPLFDEVLIISDQPQSYCKTEQVDFRISNPLNGVKAVRNIRRIAKEFKPNIVHVHQANSVGLVTGIALRKKHPIVLTTWGSDVLVLPNQNFIKKIIAQKALRHADFVTADASFMKAPILKLCPKASVEIVNFGIEVTEVLSPEDINAKENIVYSNRLHYSLYRISNIIESFAEFRNGNKEWKLIIAGNGDLTDDLKKLAENVLPKESYEFVGFVNKAENDNYYKRSKIWVSFPESDGTAVSLLEAMTFGCIPVLSDLPANSEWVNGDNGVIVMDDNLTKGIKTGSKMNPEEVWALNTDIIEKRASKKGVRELYAKLYNSLIV